VKRSAGVTASAVIVFIGSSCVFLLAGFSILGTVIVWREGSTPGLIRDAMAFAIVLEAGFAAWGLASGIGILRLREWARISILVFSALLLLVCLPGIVLMFAMPPAPPPNVSDATLYRQMFLATRIVVAVLYGLLSLTAALWLWFFNTRAVRDQFKGAQSLPNITAGPEMVSVEAPRRLRVRPVSISIIAWYMVITGALAPASIALHVPMVMLWFLLKGHAASAVLSSMGILQIVVGIALLKLRNWARILAICYFAFIAFNSLIMVVVPRAHASYQQVADEVQSKFEVPTINSSTAPVAPRMPLWIGLVFSLPLQGVIVWFLVRNKAAFAPPAQQNTA
jgi:hypothetical protein